MRNVYVYCEGQTEETFVKNLLQPYFMSKGIFLYPIVHRTKEGPSGIFKGGLTDYNKAVREINRLCRQHPNEIVTSFIDYYGLHNLPKTDTDTDKYQMIGEVEQKFFSDVDCKNFIAYISLHEFESLLFTDPSEFAYLNVQAVSTFQAVLSEFNGNPELINCGVETAPSKRILKEINDYSKVLDGNTIANRLSLYAIREKCRHFDAWIRRLEGIIG